jgi:hypothetical protein
LPDRFAREVEPRPSHDFNWLAAVGENEGANHRYESAIVDLRRRHSRLNWQDVTREGKWRRIAR